MKAIVIYYSLDGNSRLVAESIKAQCGADVLELELKDGKKRSGFAKMVWGGAMVFFKKKPVLKPFTLDIGKYDLVIIGGPVWADSIAPPVMSFISQVSIQNKKLSFFSCFMGSAGKSLKQLCSALPGNTTAGVHGFKSPSKMKRDQLENEVKGWLAELLGGN